MPKLFLCIIFGLLSLQSSAQVEANSVAPQFSEEKISHIPNRNDDLKAERLLQEMARKAGWFPQIKLQVVHGIVVIEGKAKDQKQLTWLAQTAGKLPTVIAVVNKAELITPPLTDMSPFFNELKRIGNLIKKNIPRVGMGILMASLLFFLGLKIQNFSKGLWQKRISNIFLAATVARLIMLPLWLMFFYLSLMTIGLQGLASTIIGGTGVLGIVLGFAFKGIAENYLSGLLLAIRSPFTQGDAVKIDDIEGIVQNLNMRGTTLMDYDGNLVLVPNITVIQSVVKNLSVNQNKRATFIIGVGFTDSVKKCQELIQEALMTVKGICQEPSPSILVDTVGTSTINIKVYFWYNSKNSSESKLKSSAIIKTKEILLANGIHLPDSARELILTEALKVQVVEDNHELEIKREEKSHQLKAQAEENFNDALTPSHEADHEDELRKIAKTVSLPTQSPSDNLLNR